MDLDAVDANLARGVIKLGGPACVVAMSDGFTDYCERPGSVSEIAEGSELPTTIVERLVRAAFDGGAGDNVALAVAQRL